MWRWPEGVRAAIHRSKRRVERTGSASTAEFGDQSLEIRWGHSGSEGGDRGRRREVTESESTAKVGTGGEGGVGLVIGPPLERAEEEKSDDIAGIGRGPSSGAGRANGVGGGEVADESAEESEEGPPTVTEESTVTGPIDPSEPMLRGRWVFRSVGLWRSSGRKAPSVVGGVHNQSVAEALSSSRASTRTARQPGGFSVNLRGTVRKPVALPEEGENGVDQRARGSRGLGGACGVDHPAGDDRTGPVPRHRDEPRTEEGSEPFAIEPVLQVADLPVATSELRRRARAGRLGCGSTGPRRECRGRRTRPRAPTLPGARACGRGPTREASTVPGRRPRARPSPAGVGEGAEESGVRDHRLPVAAPRLRASVYRRASSSSRRCFEGEELGGGGELEARCGSESTLGLREAPFRPVVRATASTAVVFPAADAPSIAMTLPGATRTVRARSEDRSRR